MHGDDKRDKRDKTEGHRQDRQAGRQASRHREREADRQTAAEIEQKYGGWVGVRRRMRTERGAEVDKWYKQIS